MVHKSASVTHLLLLVELVAAVTFVVAAVAAVGVGLVTAAG
jgi:hypothetical protein